MKSKIVKISLCIISTFLVLVNLHAQDTSKEEQENEYKGSIKVIATTMQNTIALRWSASNANTWQQTNETGFVIERFTIKRNGVALKEPENSVLTKIPLKHAPVRRSVKFDNLGVRHSVSLCRS
jgi:hypothetical protein